MKLYEVLENNPVAFLDEDNTYVGDQPLDTQQVSFDVAYSRPVGTFNGLEIWGSKYFGKNIDLYGIIDEQRNILAWCTLDVVQNTGYSTLTRVWVDPTQRGKNLVLTLINFITEKLKEKVMIDSRELTSSSSRGMIQKWVNLDPQYRHFTIKFVQNGQEITTPNVADILQQGSVNNVAVIFESMYNRNLPRYGAGKRIVSDFKWY